MQSLILAASILISNPVDVQELNQQQVQISNEASLQINSMNQQMLVELRNRFQQQMLKSPRIIAKTNNDNTVLQTREAD